MRESGKSDIIKLFASMILFIVLFAIAHEETHRVIYSYYGIDSKIGIGDFSKGEFLVTYANSTQFNELCDASETACVSLVESQSMVENVGYQMSFLFFVLFSILLSIYVRLIKIERGVSNAIQKKR